VEPDSDEENGECTAPVEVKEKPMSADSKHKFKDQKPLVSWTTQNPKFSSQPKNNEAEDTAQLVSKLISKSEVDLFQAYFDDDMLSFIIEESTKYANQQNRHGFELQPYQLLRFLGFLLFTGYHKLPREDVLGKRR
jgi:hypothetical protein